MVTAYVVFRPNELPDDEYDELLDEWLVWLSKRFKNVSFQTTWIRERHNMELNELRRQIDAQMEGCEFCFIIANSDFRLMELRADGAFNGQKIDLSFLGPIAPTETDQNLSLHKALSTVDNLLLSYGRLMQRCHLHEVKYGEQA